MRWLPCDLLDRSRGELPWCWPAIKRHFTGKMWRPIYSVCTIFSNTYQINAIGLEVKAQMVLRYMHGELISQFKDIIWKPCPWISLALKALIVLIYCMVQHASQQVNQRVRFYDGIMKVIHSSFGEVKLSCHQVLLPEIRWHQREISNQKHIKEKVKHRGSATRLLHW